MDDFEYSVEICDRDWECFFMECEECNLLPPPSAGVDDSGMSDIDDTGSIVAKRIQKVDLMVDYSEADHPIDGPPDCEGPPVEHYLSKHGVSGMESVLSGSEEDIHLQSVNMFFERLKNFTEGETFAEPSQVKAGEAKTEEKQNSDGQQASSSTLPKNIPKLNSLPARGEAAVDKETMRPVDIFSSVNAMKKVKPGFSISPESAASNISAYPQREFFIREQTCTETTVKETTQKNQFNDLLDEVVCSEPTTHTDEAMNMEMRTALTDVKQEDLLTSQFALSKKCSADLPNNLEMVTNVKCKEEQNSNVPQMNATSTNKTATQESSPSASIKRKRRKKRRLSVEPAESGHGYGSHVLVKQETQDSEEEQDTWRGGTGLCLSEETNLFYSHEPQKNHHVMSSLYSDSLPVRLSAREINEISHSVPAHGGQYQHLQDSIVRQGRCKATGSGENSTNSCQSVVPLSQTDESVMSVPNNSSNVVTALQPCMKLQVEELHELNKCSRLPLSLTTSVTSKSDQARETALRERKAAPAGSFRQSNKVIHSVIGCENNQNLKFCAAEVKSTSNSILPSAVSDDLAVEVNQNDRVSVAKLVLAVQAGNSGRDNHTLCQRHPEPQQQLEIDCQDIDQYDSSLGSTRLSTSGTISPDTHNTKPQQFKTRASSFLDVISSKVTCAKLASDCINTACDKSCLSNHPSSLYMNDTEVKESQMMAWNPCPPDEINLTGHSQRETKLSMSEDLLISPSEMTLESSCSALDTESVMSLLNENITDMSASFCSSVSQIASGGQGEQKNPILAKHEEGDAPFVPKSQFVSNDSSESRCDLLDLAEDAITASRTEPKIPLDSKHSFTMSSFWSEMEKLTINDILDLRRMNKAVSSSSLPPLQENEQTDSGFFTQLDEPNPKQTNECTSNVPDSAQSSLASVTTFDSSSSGSVMWESEPVPSSLGADIYPEDMLFTSVDDISQPALSGRQISKNISMHNLYALESESFSSTWKGQTLPTLDKGELEKVEYFTDEHATKEDTDSLPSSLTDSYRTTLVDIFQYLFGVKQSVPSHSAPDNITTFSTDGNSVPETYDHFFSEFDTESLFCPLITADQEKDNLVPIFSCSRSANRNLQFPEAYDYFFTSLSSDDSSDEEGDNCGPVRVVTRFSHKANTSQISTDIYENFYTDNDLRQNFFWKGTLSFRNINLTASTIQKQTLSSSQSIVPLRQSKRSLRSTVCPSNVLGNQDVVFSDPLLCCLEDRISRQLAQWPFRCEDLQMAVSTPRLDSSLLPLRQSDMCLVCIAFASWVLKTANPQVGDAWKAVLLANVSALSAIQYLRKYVRMEAAAAEEKLNHSASAS